MKNVLITGAAGFIGSYLVEHHLAQQHAVWGVDNFCSSSPQSLHHMALLGRSNYHFNNVDITSTSFQDILGEQRFDLIYNFACPASPPRYQQIPIETTMTCVVGTKNVLDVAKRTRAVVVHASTSEVYGDPTESPQRESYRGCVNPYGPRSCYDEGKRAAEALCYDYYRQEGVDVRLARIFNTYGPRMDPFDGRVVTNFIVQALLKKPMTIYGRGDQTRSFCYVTDLVRGVVALAGLEKNPTTPVNLGNSIELTVMQLGQLVQGKIGGEFDFKDLPVDDPMRRNPDITLAKNLLNWEPAVDISAGLDQTIDYMKRVV